ncbi:IAA-alanine resistance protein 1 isoform X2 [Alnus glutinosa]|uniref:IAA-alanine resistance protein 1 isoform X2 n=1 Tax=Alnus glutinosa TaxID=3517 RepID=UPI002D783507|nr:IAA-alanine resistance protein 1 isoform X2 [Alnus glutinosa]
MALRISLLITALVVGLCLDLSWGHSGLGVSQVHESSGHDDHCNHGHDHGHHHHHDEERSVSKLPEELAEEEDMKLYGFGFEHDHDHKHFGGASDLSGLGLWVNALGCSFLVSMASLICLIILPVIFVRGKPSKTVVDSLALFGAGAMLGDAFLHQLPHAFAGIVLFLLVEKVVRYVEDKSRGAHAWSHGHHHHHHKSTKILKDDDNSHDIMQSLSLDGKEGKTLEMSSEGKVSGEVSEEASKGNDLTHHELRKRSTGAGAREDKADVDFANNFTEDTHLKEKEPSQSSTNLVFGYLNLFSDGVHNFTDGMALGSAFLLYGSVGGWSRTLFLLAHELPQEVGDFGILVMSGFSVPKALFFNFLSAVVALAGTAMALLLGQDPGQSSFIEGFTAGGFIYIAVGVLAEMNNKANSTLKCTAIHLTSLILGMAVALCISLVE